MRLKVTTEKGKRTVVEGDAEAFFWLLNAAGNARNGLSGNEIRLADGGVLELRPERPLERQPRGRVHHQTAEAS